MRTLQIVGQGRVGHAVHAALSGSPRFDLLPLAGRGATGMVGDRAAHIVLLAVSDAEISNAAELIAEGPIVGHLSGSTTLEALGARESLSLHPLLTITREGADFRGAPGAIAGSSPRALALAEELAAELGLAAFEVRDADRAAYHAAASVASNYLLALEDFAERLAESAGVPRQALLPLVRATVDNWAAQGAAAALTGPVARGDQATVARQRAAVAERLPEQLDLFDELTRATRTLTDSGESA